MTRTYCFQLHLLLSPHTKESKFYYSGIRKINIDNIYPVTGMNLIVFRYIKRESIMKTKFVLCVLL